MGTEEHDTIESLVSLIQTHPLIDNHAHNLLKTHDHPDTHNRPFLSITSEASGDALLFVPSTLSHQRAIKQLSSPAMFDCSPSLEAVKAARESMDIDELNRKCLAGTQAILIDDGLPDPENCMLSYDYHDHYTPSKNKRIVRIESLMESIIETACDRSTTGNILGAIDDLLSWFPERIVALLEDPNVVGFKSVVGYRTGLDVEVQRERVRVSEEAYPGELVLGSEADSLVDSWLERKYRIENKMFNDYLVNKTCYEIDKWVKSGKPGKPFQFHTGLGDNDMSLVKSNPAYLQPLISEYPNVHFVLLHASYPFSREAAYLASTYANVHLDIGEVFPQLAKHGQKAIFKEMMELAPGEKVMWSSDGHWWPETYWLANVQVREVFTEVFTKWVAKGYVTIAQAKQMVKNIFFENANKLYKLGLVPESQDATSEGKPWVALLRTPTDAEPNRDYQYLQTFLRSNQTVRFIRLQWVDYTNTLRCRVVPVAEARRMVEKGTFLGVTQATLSILQDCTPIDEGFTPTGMWDLVPDWSSLRKYGVGNCEHAGAFCAFKERGTGKLGEGNGEVPICPRSTLKRLLKEAEEKHNFRLKSGFETEVVFLRRVPVKTATNTSKPDPGSDSNSNPILTGEPEYKYLPISTAHAWSSSRALHGSALTILTEINDALKASGIEVQYIHTEAALGQYEVVTGPLEGIAAIDAAYHTREIIQMVSEKHGIRATLHPKLFDGQPGTAAHMHFSFVPVSAASDLDSEDCKKLVYHAIDGILSDLKAICAFSYSHMCSYKRSIDSAWAGGRYSAWGTENREVPLRRIGKGYGSDGGRWEFRCLDGLANLYLVTAAMMGSSLGGIEAARDGFDERWKEVTGDPALLTPQEKSRMPLLPDQLLGALVELDNGRSSHKKRPSFFRQKSTPDFFFFEEKVGRKVVDMYIAAKMAELSSVAVTDDAWIVERY